VDNGENTLPKKIRNGEIAQYNFILGKQDDLFTNCMSLTISYIIICSVVGQEELEARSVNVRNRDDVGTKAKTQMVPLDEIVEKLLKLKNSRSLHNKFE
jgi:threonyl-tRNA synthetase